MTIATWRAFAVLAASLAFCLPIYSCDKLKEGRNPGPGTGGSDRPAFTPTVVVQWNQEALEAIRNGPPRPTVVARSLHLLHLAIYEAWAPYDADALAVRHGDALRRPVEEHNDDNRRRAISFAAVRMLQALFPAYEAATGAFSNRLSALGLEPSDGFDPTTPEGIGNLAALAILAAYHDDGSNYANNYAQVPNEAFPSLYVPVNSADPSAPNAPGGDKFDLARWQPLRVPTGTVVDADGIPMADRDVPDSFVDQSFLTPHWGGIRTFGLASGSEFRPLPPPMPGDFTTYVDAEGHVTTGDDAFRMQLEEVLEYSANLTDERKVIAEYWIDGPASETPPGHWNLLAHCISFRDGHTIGDDVRLYFVLNAAMHDAAVACWDAKRFYDTVRPMSAIRHLYRGQPIAAWAGPGLGTQLIDGADWHPYQPYTFVTPPFPEYTSGHSTFSSAAARVLTLFTGSPSFHDPDVSLPFDFNGDGTFDIIGQHIARPGSLLLDIGPADAVVLSWPTFADAAREAGISRVYGGIHIRDGNLRALEMGEKVGQRAFDVASAFWIGQQ